jgi:hypothetical protein
MEKKEPFSYRTLFKTSNFVWQQQYDEELMENTYEREQINMWLKPSIRKYI